jgi:hypothetical protein
MIEQKTTVGGIGRPLTRGRGLKQMRQMAVPDEHGRPLTRGRGLKQPILFVLQDAFVSPAHTRAWIETAVVKQSVVQGQGDWVNL